MKDKKLSFDPDTELRSDMWEKLSLNDLWLQKILLQQRINYCISTGKIDMRKQMERGMAFLQALIDEKSRKEKPDESIYL